MNGNWHYLIGIVVFVALWLLVKEITFSLILAPIALSAFPDVDLKLKNHRWILTHSIILWVIVAWFNVGLWSVLICLSIGIHLLSDITLSPSKWMGTYCLKLWGKKSFFWFVDSGRGALTTLWLLLNFILSVIIVVIALWVW